MKYSDQICIWLKELGYTHCFFVAGGNIMHILESASKHFVCVPVIHEVTAGIAVEYFNESNLTSEDKAFALVTAGPGLTNILTALAGAFLESRELLVIGGQVKSSDLKNPELRQLGIQEIDGISVAKNFCVETLQITSPVGKSNFIDPIVSGYTARKGPVFIEFCLDAQAAALAEKDIDNHLTERKQLDNAPIDFNGIYEQIQSSKRPVLLIGGGVDRKTTQLLENELKNFPFPVMTTWNATDRISSKAKPYMGRPNTWGQRYSNVLIQQSDLLIAVGTRLGLQQTGFNWKEFIPVGKVIQVDIDKEELDKVNPKVDIKLQCDANEFLIEMVKGVRQFESNSWNNWFEFCDMVKSKLPTSEDSNSRNPDYVNPYDFYLEISKLLEVGDSVIPSSSGAAETVAMQALEQIDGVTVITSKGLASMGYGLGGAIGAAYKSKKRVFHIEGDGGFAQNLQDLGTVSINNLNIKTFLFCNDGYASIRMTQKNYFDGHYVGCDINTGLGLPAWEKLFESFSIPVFTIGPNGLNDVNVIKVITNPGPAAFLVKIDPDQTYFPKISSRIGPNGEIESNPIHKMSPDLSTELSEKVFKFLV
jgi:acetolactate synthase-1/2/3 large subunit